MAFAFNENLSGADSEESLRNTVEEERLLFEENDVIDYYESRAARGDDYAALALDVVHNRGLGKLANAWLFNNVKALPPEALENFLGGDTYIEFQRSVNIGLARAHFMAVESDTRGRFGLLSADQITEYHEVYFTQRGLPYTTFGGSFLGFRTSYWCAGCDTE